MTGPTKDQRPLLIVSLEGLVTSAIGCYGSSWNATPAIDQMAADGCVWDRWITTVDDSTEPVCSLLKDGPGQACPAQAWTAPWQKRGSLELVTDVAKVAAAANGFDGIIQLNRDPTPSHPAEEIDETALAAIMAAAIERDAETDGDWSLMWLHTDVLTRCWDAPRMLFPLDDEELSGEPCEFAEPSETDGLGIDRESIPPIMPGCTVPKIDWSDGGFKGLAMDSGREDSGTVHPDAVMSWMRTYGCQIRLLDLMLEILMPSFRCENPRLLLMGTSGFSFGQNGWIGHHTGPLRSPDCRLPLIVSDTGPVRMPAVTGDTDLAALLRELGSGQMSWCGPQRWTQEDRDVCIETKSDRATVAKTTSEWFFVEDPDESDHLFLKPDDAEDFNDVARLRPDVVESLRD